MLTAVYFFPKKGQELNESLIFKLLYTLAYYMFFRMIILWLWNLQQHYKGKQCRTKVPNYKVKISCLLISVPLMPENAVYCVFGHCIVFYYEMQFAFVLCNVDVIRGNTYVKEMQDAKRLTMIRGVHQGGSLSYFLFVVYELLKSPKVVLLLTMILILFLWQMWTKPTEFRSEVVVWVYYADLVKSSLKQQKSIMC